MTFSPRCTVPRSRVAAGLLLVGGPVAIGWALVLGLLAGAAWLAALPLGSSLLPVAELLGAFGGGLVLVGVLLDQTRSLAEARAKRRSASFDRRQRPSGPSSSGTGQEPRN